MLIDPDAAFATLTAAAAGAATKPIMVPRGATTLPIAVSGLTAGVVRVELALCGELRDRLSGARWFDLGTGLDLSVANGLYRMVPVAGALAVRLAIRTAADELVAVYVGEAT